MRCLALCLLLLAVLAAATRMERLAERGRLQFAARTAAAMAAAADRGPLAERLWTRARLRRLESSTARASWALSEVSTLLPPGPLPPEARWLPPAVYLEEAPAVIDALRAGRPIEVGDDFTTDGPPDSSGHDLAPMEALLLARRGVAPERALEVATLLERCRRALEDSEADWAALPPAPPGPLLETFSENDVASHAALQVEERPGPGLPLGHPAEHLALCPLCRGERSAAWIRSLGYEPEDFATTERLLAVHRREVGADRARLVELFGPPASTDGERRWRYRLPGWTVEYTFGSGAGATVRIISGGSSGSPR